ncbi:helix-turn-helix domain-containing protein [Bacillus sp. FSL R9-9410]|uniref:helix-turn-helix domain-containing protein n=1 Tax=Bacillus sp. FSL R9-9410 TaxID=2921590 RepID=UPI004049FBD4
MRNIGCSRFVFNRFLAMWNHTYKEAGKGLTYHFFSDELTQLKKKMVREARCSYIKNVYF